VPRLLHFHGTADIICSFAVVFNGGVAFSADRVKDKAISYMPIDYRNKAPVKNGNSWITLENDKEKKLLYLSGINDGVTNALKLIAFQENKSPKLHALFYNELVSTPAMVEQIDEFYKESMNRKIPVGEVLLYIRMQEKKLPKDTLKTYHRNMRDTYSDY
jgi:hypothetical protein